MCEKCSKQEGIFWTIVLIALFVIVSMKNNNQKRESTIPPDVAAQCIIGEAEDQGQEGMEAVACALIERGTTEGVSGCTSNRVKNKLYSKKIETSAHQAWARAHVDYNHCAWLVGYSDSWQSLDDIEGPLSLVGKCPITAQVGDHVFFNCSKE